MLECYIGCGTTYHSFGQKENVDLDLRDHVDGN